MSSPSEEWTRIERHYRRLSDDELLRLSVSPDELTPVARDVLYQELGRRGLTPGKPQPVVADNDEQFVRLVQGHDLAELLFMQKSLASLGIEAQIEEQEDHTLAWFLQHEMDGLSLFVRRKDADSAREVLSSPFDQSSAEDE